MFLSLTRRFKNLGVSCGEKFAELTLNKRTKIYSNRNDCLYYIGETLWPLWYGNTSDSIEISDEDPNQCLIFVLMHVDMIYSRDLRLSKCFSTRESILPSGPCSIFLGIITAFLTGSGHVFIYIESLLFVGGCSRFTKLFTTRSAERCCYN